MKKEDVSDATESYLKCIIRKIDECTKVDFHYPLLALTDSTSKSVYRVYFSLKMTLEASDGKRNVDQKLLELCIHEIRKDFNRSIGPQFTNGEVFLRPSMKSVNQKSCCPFGTEYINNTCGKSATNLELNVPCTIFKILINKVLLKHEQI